MAYHPDFPVLESSTWSGGGYSTNVAYARSGKRWAGLERTGQIRQWNVELDWLSYDDAATWMAFFDARKGAFEPFYWFGWYRTSRAMLVGTAPGGLATFDCPFKDSLAPPKVTVAALVTPAGYAFMPNGGAGGEDRITFLPGNVPTNGQTITALTFQARERYYVHFKRDVYDTSFRFGDGGIQTKFKFELEEEL